MVLIAFVLGPHLKVYVDTASGDRYLVFGRNPGAYLGFLERGIICVVWGFALLILSIFFFNIPWKLNILVSLRHFFNFILM